MEDDQEDMIDDVNGDGDVWVEVLCEHVQSGEIKS